MNLCLGRVFAISLIFLFHQTSGRYLLVEVGNTEGNSIRKCSLAENYPPWPMKVCNIPGEQCLCDGMILKSMPPQCIRQAYCGKPKRRARTMKRLDNASWRNIDVARVGPGEEPESKTKDELQGGKVNRGRSLSSTGFDSHKNRNLVNQKGCGRRGFSQKIVGGTTTNIKDFPWLALIAGQLKCDGLIKTCNANHCGECSEDALSCSNGDCDGPTLKYVCAGALISDYWVLSASHCIRDANVGFKVKLGATSRTQKGGFQIIDAEKWIKHENFVQQGFKNDIALIKLKKKPRKSPKINTICLPLDKSKEFNYEEENFRGQYDAIIAGWGYTTKRGQGGPAADTLQKLSVKIIPHQKCYENMKGYAEVNVYNGLHADKNICAGGEYEKDSCGGDSGGPLVVSKKKGVRETYTVAGITSWGPTQCGGQTDQYGIYTNVAYHNKWILDHLD